jgi:hypothetical protein
MSQQWWGSYTPTMKWFRLEGQSGDVARISAMLIVLPEFARVLLAHTPPGVIDAETLPILEARLPASLHLSGAKSMWRGLTVLVEGTRAGA